MLLFSLKLAFKSLRRNPFLTAITIGAIALGVGVSTTTLTVYHMMSGDPIPAKSHQLYAVQMDNWDPNEAYRDPDEPPEQLSYRDSVALLEAAWGTRQSAGFSSNVVVYPPNPDEPPDEPRARFTSGDFFAMFDVPFLYGAAWDAASEASEAQVVVITRRLNERLFAGESSVGKRLRVGERYYSIVGVMDEWKPLPKFYDVQSDTFEETEQLFFPFSLVPVLEPRKNGGNISCWKDPGGDSYRSFLDSECIWIQYWVELPTAADLAAYRAKLDAYVQEQKSFGRFPRPLNNHARPVMEWMRYMRVVQEDTRVLVGLAFMFLAVCLLNTMGFLLDKFLGRPGEDAVRRALGASKLILLRERLVEVGLVGLVGGALGLGLSWLGLQAVKRLYSNLDEIAHLDVGMVATALAIAVAATLLAGLYPTWRSCQVPPAQYLKTQ